MSWIKIILGLLVEGVKWLNNKQLLDAGRKSQREEDKDETIKALEARDSVNDADVDKLLLPPDKR